MDPNIKLLADELHKRFDDLDLKWEQRLLDTELRLGARVDNLEVRHQARIDGLEAQHGERLNLVDSLLVYQGDRVDRAHNLAALHDERLGRLKGAALTFDDWCPRIEVSIDDLKREIKKVACAGERPAPERPSSGRGILPLPKSAMERPPAPDCHADGPIGHRLPPHYRDDGFGSVFTVSHHPVNGAHTIGRARCALFSNRLSNFSATESVDPTLDASLAESLEQLCAGGDGNQTTALDVTTADVFDNKYYQNLLQEKGLLSSDQGLFSSPEGVAATKDLVQTYSADGWHFFDDFACSMIKMGNIPLTASDGEIRKNCRVPN